jgi:hypothetical protein
MNSNQDGPNPRLPKLNIEVASGITGAVFCSGCGLGPDIEGRLLYVHYDYRVGVSEIHALTLDTSRTSVVSDALLYHVPGEPALSLERGPDGRIYYSDDQSIRRLDATSTTSTTAAPTTTTTTPGTTRTALVTSVTPTRARQDFSGWVGMQLTVGGTDLRVSALGRWVPAGNAGTHTVKLVDAASGADVPGGSVDVATAGAAPGSFDYANLAHPVTLTANHSYFLVSQETAGGDTWYDADSTVATTTAARDTGYVWAYPSGGWNPGGVANQALGPLSLLYGHA